MVVFGRWGREGGQEGGLAVSEWMETGYLVNCSDKIN